MSLPIENTFCLARLPNLMWDVLEVYEALIEPRMRDISSECYWEVSHKLD